MRPDDFIFSSAFTSASFEPFLKASTKVALSSGVENWVTITLTLKVPPIWVLVPRAVASMVSTWPNTKTAIVNIVARTMQRAVLKSLSFEFILPPFWFVIQQPQPNPPVCSSPLLDSWASVRDCPDLGSEWRRWTAFPGGLTKQDQSQHKDRTNSTLAA